MKYQFMQDHKNQFPIEKMALVLGVSRSGYYKFMNKGLSKRSKENIYLKQVINDIFDTSRKTYGSIRIYQELRSREIQCGKNRVSRLMKELKLVPKSQKKYKVCTTDSKHNYPVSENLLERDFTVSAPNKVWVSDITYIRTDEGWLYLCIILDLFSRMIVGWSMLNNMETKLIINALDMAYINRAPGDKLIFHSDRGSQYASYWFREALNDYKMVSSMSKKGDCWDNACAESFFGTLKNELVYHKKYRTHEEARSDIFEYIEVFYNRQRRHSTIDYMSPCDFELLKVA
jgi:transposase InsO family protein